MAGIINRIMVASTSYPLCAIISRCNGTYQKRTWGGLESALIVQKEANLSWKILDPTAELKKATLKTVSIHSLSGKTVAFVSNEHWYSLVPIWKKLGEVLPARYGVAGTFKVQVPVTNAAPQSTLDEVASRSQAALVALAN